MRTPVEIRDRIRHLLVLELDRRVAESAKRLPLKCEHNYRHPLDVRRTVDGEINPQFNRISGKSLPVSQTIGLCMLGSDDPETWGGTICEDPVDAQRCPYFTSKTSKADILSTLREETLDLEWLRNNLPEVYGLLWALEDAVPQIPWWKVLWFRLLRVRTEPVQSVSIDRLLPATSEDDHVGI